MPDTHSPDEQNQSCLRITGRRFGQGVMAALRAYPSVFSVRRIDIDEKEYLIICLQKDINATLLTRAITNAGGEVEHIERLDTSSDDCSPSSQRQD